MTMMMKEKKKRKLDWVETATPAVTAMVARPVKADSFLPPTRIVLQVAPVVAVIQLGAWLIIQATRLQVCAAAVLSSIQFAHLTTSSAYCCFSFTSTRQQTREGCAPSS